MRLYVTAKTNFTNESNLTLDYIEVKLKNGETVSLNWDESDFGITDGIFDARYKGVYFGDEYANGRIDELKDLEITDIQFYSESDTPLDFVIQEMYFEDGDKELSILNPYYMIEDERIKGNFYEVSITFGPDDGDGYSVFVCNVMNEEEALKKAVESGLLEEPEDIHYVDYVDELTFDEFLSFTAHKLKQYLIDSDEISVMCDSNKHLPLEAQISSARGNVSNDTVSAFKTKNIEFEK